MISTQCHRLLLSQHTQTLSSTDLCLAEEIAEKVAEKEAIHQADEVINTLTTDAILGEPPARSLSINYAHDLFLGYDKNMYYLGCTQTVLNCYGAPSRTQPHELIQEFLDYSGIKIRSIHFYNAMEFGKSDHFKSWAKANGARAVPS